MRWFGTARPIPMNREPGAAGSAIHFLPLACDSCRHALAQRVIHALAFRVCLPVWSVYRRLGGGGYPVAEMSV